jgi:hypothetical protein
MSRIRPLAAMVAAAFVWAILPTAAQSELVIVKEGTRFYHRPGCPVIRDGQRVVAMTRAQAERRGLKAHSECDPANAPGDERQRTAASAASIVVHVAAGDNRYHRESCARLAADRTKLTLEEAVKKKYWPCPVCKPPVRKKADAPAVRTRSTRG